MRRVELEEGRVRWLREEERWDKYFNGRVWGNFDNADGSTPQFGL